MDNLALAQAVVRQAKELGDGEFRLCTERVVQIYNELPFSQGKLSPVDAEQKISAIFGSTKNLQDVEAISATILKNSTAEWLETAKKGPFVPLADSPAFKAIEHLKDLESVAKGVKEAEMELETAEELVQSVDAAAKAEQEFQDLVIPESQPEAVPKPESPLEKLEQEQEIQQAEQQALDQAQEAIKEANEEPEPTESVEPTESEPHPVDLDVDPDQLPEAIGEVVEPTEPVLDAEEEAKVEELEAEIIKESGDEEPLKKAATDAGTTSDARVESESESGSGSESGSESESGSGSESESEASDAEAASEAGLKPSSVETKAENTTGKPTAAPNVDNAKESGSSESSESSESESSESESDDSGESQEETTEQANEPEKAKDEPASKDEIKAEVDPIDEPMEVDDEPKESEEMEPEETNSVQEQPKPKESPKPKRSTRTRKGARTPVSDAESARSSVEPEEGKRKLREEAPTSDPKRRKTYKKRKPTARAITWATDFCTEQATSWELEDPEVVIDLEEPSELEERIHDDDIESSQELVISILRTYADYTMANSDPEELEIPIEEVDKWIRQLRVFN